MWKTVRNKNRDTLQGGTADEQVDQTEAFTPILLSNTAAPVCVTCTSLILWCWWKEEKTGVSEGGFAKSIKIPFSQLYYLNHLQEDMTLPWRIKRPMKTVKSQILAKMITCYKCNNHFHYRCVQIKRNQQDGHGRNVVFIQYVGSKSKNINKY